MIASKMGIQIAACLRVITPALAATVGAVGTVSSLAALVVVPWLMAAAKENRFRLTTNSRNSRGKLWIKLTKSRKLSDLTESQPLHSRAQGFD